MYGEGIGTHANASYLSENDRNKFPWVSVFDGGIVRYLGRDNFVIIAVVVPSFLSWSRLPRSVLKAT